MVKDDMPPPPPGLKLAVANAGAAGVDTDVFLPQPTSARLNEHTPKAKQAAT